MISSKNLEKAHVSIFFAIVLWLSVSGVWNHDLFHEYPSGFGTSDAFHNVIVTQIVKDTGAYRHKPSYYTAGKENMIAWYSPIMAHLGTYASYLTGMEPHDSVYFILVLLLSVSFILFYCMIKQLNKQIAILASSVMILVFYGKFGLALPWGQWGYLTGAIFMIASFWLISKFDLNYSYIFLGIVMGCLFIAYPLNTVYPAFFLVVYLALEIGKTKEIFSKDNLKLVKKAVIAGIIAIVLSAYYIYIFLFAVSVHMGKSGGKVDITKTGYPVAFLSDFGLILVPILIGVVIGIFILKNRKKKEKYSIIVGILMLASGFLYLFGRLIGGRSLHHRYLWPVFLSVFFGIFFYSLISMLAKKHRTLLSYLTSWALILIFIFALPSWPSASGGLMSPYKWAAYKWMQNNIEENTSIFMFYTDSLSQTTVEISSKRIITAVDYRQFADLIKNRTVERYHNSKMYTLYMFRKEGTFEFKDYREKEWKKRDICGFEYFVFDKASRQQALAQYNLLIANKLVEEGAEIVFQNEGMVILKNNNIGGGCIEQGKF